MPKLSIYNTGNFFTRAEMAGARVAKVGGGTGYRYAVLELPNGDYMARARTKGGTYAEGEGDSTIVTDDAQDLYAWEDTLTKEGTWQH